MVFACCGVCLGTWSTLELWLQAESLWESDTGESHWLEGEDGSDPAVVNPYWPGSLQGPW